MVGVVSRRAGTTAKGPPSQSASATIAPHAPNAIPIGPRMTQATRRRTVSQREWLPITGGIVAQPTFRLSRVSRLSLPLRVRPMLAHVDRGLLITPTGGSTAANRPNEVRRARAQPGERDET